MILEKGLLDAVYLAGDGHVEQAVAQLQRVLKPGGIFVSCSGVVPAPLRQAMFSVSGNANKNNYSTSKNVNNEGNAKQAGKNGNSTSCSGKWAWLRDGSADLKAGCFVFRKEGEE